VTVSVLVPFRDGGCEWRQQAWEYVRRLYEQRHPAWELVVGSCDGEWSKGAALDDAYRRAAGDVVVLADADSFCDPAVLDRAVAATASSSWVVPHRMVHRLSARATEDVYAGGRPRASQVVRRPYMGPAGGGITVLTREAFELAGGIDPRFRGWGGEDLSFGWALHTLAGPGRRLGSPLWALWHPHPAPDRRGSSESEALAGRYRRARGDPEAMTALISERARC
jgi:hypothetical protein